MYISANVNLKFPSDTIIIYGFMLSAVLLKYVLYIIFDIGCASFIHSAILIVYEVERLINIRYAHDILLYELLLDEFLSMTEIMRKDSNQI